MVGLLVCDDSEHARAAVRELFAGDSDITVVGEAADGLDAVSQAVALRPDVVLMDVRMPLLDGVEATRRIREVVPSARVVGWAGSDELEVVVAMLDAGAAGYCVKGAPLWELERVVLGVSDPLLRLAHGLTRSLEAGGASELVARELATLTGAEVVAVYLVGADGAAVLAAAAGAEGRSLAQAAPTLLGRAVRARTLVQANVHELTEVREFGVEAGQALAAPLICEGEVLGGLLLVMPVRARREVDQTLLTASADLAAAALANERRLALTFAEARRDPLTGVANRRAFDEQLERALANASRTGGSVAIAVFDLDGFKQINDSDGHPAGDEILREVARVALRSVRIDDEIFRLGGDEFAIVSESGAVAAACVAERLQRELLSQQRRHRLPTASVGIATFPEDADNQQELLRKADVALYAAKWSGRGRIVDFNQARARPTNATPPALAEGDAAAANERTLRVLVVDDDVNLRLLLRTTFEGTAIEVEEAHTAEAAEERISASAPAVIVLDVGLPGIDGLSFCRRLKTNPRTQKIAIIVLSGAEGATGTSAREAGADASLRKPFSPLALLTLIEQLAFRRNDVRTNVATGKLPQEQLLLYADDLRRLLEKEREQRRQLQQGYQQTITTLANVLDTKDTVTAAHSERVQLYALELARQIDPTLLDDSSLVYGFLLHDIGKIGIPERILQKRGQLTSQERQLVQTHTILGEQILAGLALLEGGGLEVVRHHHERWDGRGYPDRLHTNQIPVGARIFAVADTLDAITSDRPYRAARDWNTATTEIRRQAGHQFDPSVVEAFCSAEHRLRLTRERLTAA